MKNHFSKQLLIIFLCIAANSFAQDYSFKDYNWEDKNTSIQVPDQYKDENEVILLRKTKIELSVKGSQANQYYLLHEKKYINSNDAIERNNRVYIPFNMDESVIETKVRVIHKDGKVVLMDKKDIKEEIDEEKQVKYTYFAINGLDKGAVIEKIFIIAENPELDGKTFRIQSNIPMVSNEFQLIFPKHLKFKTKCYNGLAEPILAVAKDTLKNSLTVSTENIPGIDDDERYSNWDLNLKLFRYKLDENNYTGSKNINSFSKFSSNFFERINPALDKKEQKIVDEFYKQIPKKNTPIEQIWEIENKIKKTINYNKYAPNAENIAAIFKSKQANKVDLLKVYMAVLKPFAIESKIVLASNRYEIPFDKEFESYENLAEALLYFPAINHFLTPTEIEYRIPYFPDTLGNNNGLFISQKIFGGVAMGISEVNFIPLPSAEFTRDDMDITVDFTESLENPKITTVLSFGGYSALNFQPVKDFASADQYKAFLKSLSENYTINNEYTSLKTENDGLDFVGKKPFVMTIVFNGKDLLQKAGPNYLFPVGKLIGSQMELYQENQRKLPVEIDHPHSYFRTLKIKLPKDIKAKNLEKFIMDFKTEINNKVEAGFVSSYDEKNGVITVSNNEYYNIVNYPLDKFNEYKAVINAAADFNKIVIILSKS